MTLILITKLTICVSNNPDVYRLWPQNDKRNYLISFATIANRYLILNLEMTFSSFPKCKKKNIIDSQILWQPNYCKISSTIPKVKTTHVSVSGKMN